MKTFNTLKWTGYLIFGTPLLLTLVALSIFAINAQDDSVVINSNESMKITHIDTVEFKVVVYDTVKINVPIKKIFNKTEQVITDTIHTKIPVI